MTIVIDSMAGVGTATAEKILNVGSIYDHVMGDLLSKLSLNKKQTEQYNAFFKGVNVSVLAHNDLRHVYGCSANTMPGKSVRDVCLETFGLDTKFAVFKWSNKK